MALFVRQDDKRSELQRRIAAELQEKARAKAEGALPDGVDDAAYVRGMKRTSPLAAVWIAIAIIGVGILVWFIISTAS